MKKKVFNKEFKTVIFDYDGTMFDTEIMQQYVGNTKKYPRFSPQWVAASKCGITAYNCLWGATDEDREVMLNDREHVCLSDPKEIIEILKSTYSPS